jgi:hypothetical protein
VRAEYPNQLDYSDHARPSKHFTSHLFKFRTTATFFPIIQELWRRP